MLKKNHSCMLLLDENEINIPINCDITIGSANEIDINHNLKGRRRFAKRKLASAAPIRFMADEFKSAQVLGEFSLQVKVRPFARGE
ncbi:hypothetical protein DTO10_13550 [Peribacillus butanolivorans]|uniref:Uncharacterized protein n=1 Tax=Peribacillus butanolivorans TaxID=421767 RepID=A0ABM6XLY6_9BACI|nr:hypothetical protein DTO10_13550 [Peribacillus butanolivorans]